MTTLARGITVTSTIVDVSDEALNVARPFLVTIDSETMRVRGLEYVSGVATRWNVDRGIDSTPATHAGGAAVTLGDGGVGGAAEPGTVVEALTGAETNYGHFYRGDEDPEVDFGAELEPGDIWIDTSTVIGAGLFPVYARKERNAANDGWQPTGLSAVDNLGNLRAFVFVDDLSITAKMLDGDGFDRVTLLMDLGQATGSFTLTVNDATGTPTAGFIMAEFGGEVTVLGTKFTLSGLPTVNPADGSLWSDAGVVKVSS